MTPPPIDLLSGELYAGDPYPSFAWMRREAPCYLDEANHIWGLSRYEDVRAVGQDPNRFSSASGSRPGIALPHMIDMDGAEHRRRRRLVNTVFTPEAVRLRNERIVEVCDRIIDSVCEAGECDLVTDVAAPLPLAMIADMLGFPEAEWKRLLDWSDTMLMSQGSDDDGALEKATAAFVEWDMFVKEHIGDRRRTGTTEDLLGMLVNGGDEPPLDEDALVHEALLILIGGDETTRHVISGGMEALLTRHEQYHEVLTDRSALHGAVEEMLRWVSPIKNMNRTATSDVELHGCTIRTGESVLLLYPSANRDEAVFADPESFDIHRRPNDHLAFGFGAHLCLGQRLARAELLAMVGRLLDRLPDMELVPGSERPLRVSNFIVGHESLPVRFTPTARSDT